MGRTQARYEELPRRLIDKIKIQDAVDDACWEWTAARSGNGYGQVKIDRRTKPAHRAVYELLVGPIPPEMELHHRCENPPCVRPDHLELIVKTDHVRSNPNWVGNRTHCPKGHALVEGNLVLSELRTRNARRCLTCHREVMARWRKGKR
mgnify:CR=1 FL=1